MDTVCLNEVFSTAEITPILFKISYGGRKFLAFVIKENVIQW